MVTLSGDNVRLLNRAGAGESSFLVGFQGNQPFSSVLISARFIPASAQSGGTDRDGIRYVAAEPAAAGIPVGDERLLQQPQGLVLDGRLSRREVEVVGHVANGSGNKQIARELTISQQTVKNHITSIMRKLGANNRAHAVTLAMRQGLISL